MPLVPMADLLRDARANGYAVPAFNVWDLQSVAALMVAAEEEQAPVILAGADMGDSIGNPFTELWASLALKCAADSRMPIAVHLDHGRSFEACMRAIRLGFSSVMIDASELPFAENVAVTRRVVEAAHAVGVSVEAELGHVGMGDEELTEAMRAELFTKPDEAVRFVEETGVDALAVAVGTLHGAYKFEPKIDWERLEALGKAVPACLVLHGASGTPGLDRAAQLGVTKVNVASEIVAAMLEALRREAANPGWEAMKSIMRATPEAQKVVMVRRLRSLGASGRGPYFLDGWSRKRVFVVAEPSVGARRGEFG